MKKSLRKILSGIIATVMVGSCLSMTIFADMGLPEELPEYYLNSDNIVWKNGDSNIKGYKNGDLLSCKYLDSSFVVAIPEDIEVTNEYLGLTDDYSIVYIDSSYPLYNLYADQYDLTGEKVYFIDNANKDDETIIDEMKNFMIEDKVDASFNHKSYSYEVWQLDSLTINLKTPDENFSVDKYDGLKGLELKKKDDAGQQYEVNIKSVNVNDIAGILEQVNSDENIENTNVNMRSDAMGITVFEAKPSFIRIDGDSNSDNRLNVRDAAFIAQKMAEQKSSELPEYADYNLDGSVNVRDAAGIARFMAEKSVPAEK
ncbi:dockerin type I domain-containing protein [Porcipelethomonas sp.]|uniref:dockerin type I domain-containing protein n=1 Tax=Porcipelethomonas sp. TaxID=2981675 RepID=UPI003EF3C0C8